MGGTAKPTKTDMMAARPARSAEATVEPAGERAWRVTVPLRPSKWAAKLLRVPAGQSKTFELDEIGKFVWDACDGQASVADVIGAVARQYNLSARESEVATVAFLRTLVAKGLIGMKMEPQMNADERG